MKLEAGQYVQDFEALWGTVASSPSLPNGSASTQHMPMPFSPADWPCIGFDHPSEQSSRPLLGFLALELICSHIAVYRTLQYIQYSTAQHNALYIVHPTHLGVFTANWASDVRCRSLLYIQDLAALTTSGSELRWKIETKQLNARALREEWLRLKQAKPPTQ